MRSWIEVFQCSSVPSWVTTKGWESGVSYRKGKQCKGKANVLVGQMSSLSYWNIVKHEILSTKVTERLADQLSRGLLQVYALFLKLPDSLITCAKELMTAWFVSTRPGKGSNLMHESCCLAQVKPSHQIWPCDQCWAVSGAPNNWTDSCGFTLGRLVVDPWLLLKSEVSLKVHQKLDSTLQSCWWSGIWLGLSRCYVCNFDDLSKSYRDLCNGYVRWGLNSHYYQIITIKQWMVINPIVGAYLPMIRIPY